MSADGLVKRLAQLQAAYEGGILDEDTYHSAVAALSSQLGETVAVSGSSAAATHGGAAAGERGVAVAGDVHGNIYTGPETDDPEKALAIYRRVYAATCRQLPLRGVDVGAGDPQGEQKQLNLDHVYVSLNTTTRIEVGEDEQPRQRQPPMQREEARPLGALEAAHANRCLALTGDPGSGKSTFVNHLGLCLAMHGLEPQVGWIGKPAQWPAKDATLLPITVILRDFALFAAGEDDPRAPNRLWSFIRSRLERQNLDFVASHLHDRLEAGEVYLLLDGLD